MADPPGCIEQLQPDYLDPQYDQLSSIYKMQLHGSYNRDSGECTGFGPDQLRPDEMIISWQSILSNCYIKQLEMKVQCRD